MRLRIKHEVTGEPERQQTRRDDCERVSPPPPALAPLVRAHLTCSSTAAFPEFTGPFDPQSFVPGKPDKAEEVSATRSPGTGAG
jgi:hypothetical protein